MNKMISIWLLVPFFNQIYAQGRFFFFLLNVTVLAYYELQALPKLAVVMISTSMIIDNDVVLWYKIDYAP